MGYDGSIRIDSKIDNKNFNKSVESMTASVKKIGAAIGAAFSIKVITDFVRESVNASSELSNAWTGLNSILEGQGKSFSNAKKFIEEYISDGLVSATEATAAYKNLSLRGYNTEQIEKVMVALKDSATFGRQSSYELGEAIATATEGLKNENSVVVDNAGVTKNVAKMWEDYAKSIGKTTNNLTQAEKIQAEVNGILEETKFQSGDAALYLNTYSGQLARLNASFTTLKQTVGNTVIPIFQAILPYINAVIQGLIKVAQTFAAVVQLIFGKTVDTTKKIATSSASAASGISSMGDAAEKAGKQAKGALASFDKLEVLASDSSSDSSGSSGGSNGIENIDLSGLDASTSQLETISEEVQRIADNVLKFFEPIQNISLDNLINSLKNLLEAIKPFTQTIFDGLYWFYLNVLVPLAKFTIEDLIPAFLELVAGALKVLTPIMKSFKKVGEWFFDNFLKPIAKWTGGVIISVLKKLAKLLSDLGNWMSKNQKVVDAMTTAIVAFFAAWKVTQLLAFIQMSGGIIATLKKLGSAIAGVTAKKLIDKAETIYLTALYAKDFVVSIGKNIVQLGKEAAAWIASTAAKVANGIANGTLTASTVAQTVASKAATAAQWLWNAALTANPIGLVVAAVAALAAGIAALIIVQNSATEEEKKAADAAKERLEVTNEQYEAFQRQQEQHEQKVDSDLVDINNAQRLAQELKTLVDENGNVQEKDKARVEFILGQLNPALETEYKLVGNQIQGYSDLTKTIEQQIEQKKLQILLEAEEEKYKQALIKVTETEMERNKAKQEMDEAVAAWNKKQNKENAQSVLDAEENYNKLDAMCKTYNENIRTYEMATEEMLEGNTQNAIDMLQRKEKQLTTYESVLDKSSDEQNRILKEQYDEAIKDLQSYKEKYDKGLQGFTADGLKEAINFAEKAKWEYQKVGQNIVDGTTQGINGKSNALTSSVKALFNRAVNAAKQTLDSHSPSRVFEELGENTDEGYIGGIENLSGAVNKCMKSLMGGAVDAAGDTSEMFSTTNIDEFTSSTQKLVSVFNELRNIIQYVKEDLAELITQNIKLNKNLVPAIATGTITPYSQSIVKQENAIDNKTLKELLNILKQKETVKTDKIVMLQPIGDSGFARYVIKSINAEQEAAGKTLLKI